MYLSHWVRVGIDSDPATNLESEFRETFKPEAYVLRDCKPGELIVDCYVSNVSKWAAAKRAKSYVERLFNCKPDVGISSVTYIGPAVDEQRDEYRVRAIKRAIGSNGYSEGVSTNWHRIYLTRTRSPTNERNLTGQLVRRFNSLQLGRRRFCTKELEIRRPRASSNLSSAASTTGGPRFGMVALFAYLMALLGAILSGTTLVTGSRWNVFEVADFPVWLLFAIVSVVAIVGILLVPFKEASVWEKVFTILHPVISFGLIAWYVHLLKSSGIERGQFVIALLIVLALICGSGGYFIRNSKGASILALRIGALVAAIAIALQYSATVYQEFFFDALGVPSNVAFSPEVSKLDTIGLPALTIGVIAISVFGVMGWISLVIGDLSTLSLVALMGGLGGFLVSVLITLSIFAYSGNQDGLDIADQFSENGFVNSDSATTVPSVVCVEPVSDQIDLHGDEVDWSSPLLELPTEGSRLWFLSIDHGSDSEKKTVSVSASSVSMHQVDSRFDHCG